MKLSIVILCWNDLKVISDCVRSIYSSIHDLTFEVIISDNGSSDGSVEFIRKNYPQVQVIENRRNLRFAKANNVGIKRSRGEYVLILNPDTIIHDRTLDEVVRFADQNRKVGAIGCRVLNGDGSYQESAWPFRSIRGEWLAALYLRRLAYLSDWFTSDIYECWKGETRRKVDWISGCFLFVRAQVLRELKGFDEQFFYYFEDMDLCRRIWQAGHEIVYLPEFTITHLAGHSTKKRFPAIAFALDRQVTRYLYFYKYYGEAGLRQARRISLVSLTLRRFAQRLIQLAYPTDSRQKQLDLFRTLFQWHDRVDPLRLVKHGEEPVLDIEPMGRVVER